jgi:hypothetical protein
MFATAKRSMPAMVRRGEITIKPGSEYLLFYPKMAGAVSNGAIIVES